MPETRISEPTRKILRELAEASGDSVQVILDKAVEANRRQRFLEGSNQAFAMLRAKPQLWRSDQVEREAWNVTLGDDLGA
jgi:hypothetical protein